MENFHNDTIGVSEANSTVFGHDFSPVFIICISAYFITITVCALLFNLLLTMTILSKKNLQTTTNLFIVNLAIGDFLTAIFIVPFDIDFMLRGHFLGNEVYCGFREILFMWSLPKSVVSLLLLTVERFISVIFPFKKLQYLTKKTTYVLIAFSWIYTSLVAVFPIILKTNAIHAKDGDCWIVFPLAYAYFQALVNFLFPVFSISCMNILLFKIANRHAVDIRKKSLVGIKRQSLRSKPRLSTMTLGANLKAAKTVLLLVGVFLLCWLPYIILVIHNIMCNECHPPESIRIINAINYSCIFLNPLLYGLRNKNIRKEFSRLSKRVIGNCCYFFGITFLLENFEIDNRRGNSISDTFL